MKKILSVILVLILCLSLAGCERRIPTLKQASRHSCEWTEKRLDEKYLEDLVRAWGIYEFWDNAYYWKVERKNKEPLSLPWGKESGFF